MKLLSFFLLLLFQLTLVGQAGIYSEDDIKEQTSFIESLALQIDEDYSEAITKLNGLLELFPNRSVLYFERSKAYSNLEKYDKAYSDIKKAIKFDDKTLSFYQHKFDLESKLQNYDEMINSSKMLIEIEPQNIHNYYDLYNAYRFVGQSENAIQILNQTKSIFGINEELANSKVLLLKATNDADGITETYLELSNAYPQETKYIHKLADHYSVIGQTDKLEKLYQAIISISPDDPKANHFLMQKELSGNKDAMGLSKFIADASVPIDAKILQLIPLVQEMSMDAEDPQNINLKLMMNDLARLHDEQAKAHSIIGDFYFNLGQLDKAIPSYKKTISLNSNVYEVWSQLMFAYYQDLDYLSLSQVAEEAIDFFPNNIEGYYFIILAQTYNKRFDDALDYIEEAEYIGSGNDRWQKRLNSIQAHKLYVIKDYEASVKQLNNDIPGLASDPFLAKLYADNLYKLGRKKEAIQYYQKAMELGFNSSHLKALVDATGS